ncbi:MAG: hypothetical protein LAP39_21560 [Acidobacteriia bacterium]|nr:hypothetical protein [Terriglobia bacterium]
MNSTTLWWQFWQLAFVVAVSSFAIIAAIVATRGFSDLRDLIQLLKREQEARISRRQD